MGEFAQRGLEDLAPVFSQLQHAQLFTPQEIKLVVKKCKAHEYRLVKPSKRKGDFVDYAQYLIHWLALIRRRREKVRYWFKSNEIDLVLARKIDALFRVACIRFPNDVRMWLSRIEFAKKRKAGEAISKMYTRMLQMHSKNASVWLSAAKWECEELGSVETARALLQRALRFLPGEKKLWIELFRLELIYVEKIRKRREVIQAGTSSDKDDVEDSVLECGLAKLAFSHAMKSEAAEHDPGVFCTEFLPVVKKFPFAKGVEDEIYEREFEKSEQGWKARAMRAFEPEEENVMSKGEKRSAREERACAVFEEAVKTVDTESMWKDYIEFCLMLCRDPESKGSEHRLLKVLKRAHGSFPLSERYYLLWTEVSSSNKRKVLEDGISRRSKAGISSPALWTELLRGLIEQGAPKSTIRRMFNAALQGLSEQESVPVWCLAIAWRAAFEGERKVQKVVENALCSSSVVASSVKEFVLDSVLDMTRGEGRNLEKLVRKLCESRPNSVLFYRKLIKKVEGGLRREVFEMALNEHGEESVDLWMECVKDQPQKCKLVCARAKRGLRPERVREFVEKFARWKAGVK